MKIYNNNDARAVESYQNESRFCWLKNENIVNFHGYGTKVVDSSSDRVTNASFILMELAFYGDFSDLIKIHHIFSDEKLVRTYFHQLVSAIEYLHSVGVAHLDLKTDNILLCENFKLKICDFDRSYHDKDRKIKSRGTCNYRAPEIRYGGLKNVYAPDIYSMGIILFLLKFGRLPFIEDKNIEGISLEELLNKGDLIDFFTAHRDLKTFEDVDEDFAKLFWSMTRPNYTQRATIKQIKQNAWYKEEVYTQEELESIMNGKLKYFRNADDESEMQRKQQFI
mmetsp:Transcript_24221/g.21329  ORF Transcript_24221/g.21329 Transcript_24221/m.21329 type:complete len:280 (-) Transcript_24221:651-1490(-)|eukprot:CAMPEP_0114596034 /NCGR_PEP_ID=MMETSP0125-20121206/17976_1 /TAXON_ID=485358 ORGANISM="Aristerostoma sp., Strain ATCC 50986" /NCGR_SAMPLE_ID=MMETSP0125 /ASSEMBLY_ACC=CAM_ASM_000245 /LENGTH=279 /DNA_ID=CAMNT_0001798505 /DNA_START=240 /DNA_END=1079 /DNA_ORIENTATION=-